MISEHEFFRVQQILDLKKANHWRSRPDHERRFTFSGFLRCGLCGNLMYTHAHKPRDWYVCKSRTYPERQIRAKKALPACNNPYMRREKIEAHLDEIFAKRLSDQGFLERITSELIERHESKTNKAEKSKFQRMRKGLQEKRQRLLDAYFEKLISRTELDRRLAQIITDERFCDQKLDNLPNEMQNISVRDLAEILAPLQEWIFLSRTDKRRLLQTIVPEIHIQNYQVTQLAVMALQPYRDEINRTGMDSSPRPA